MRTRRCGQVHSALLGPPHDLSPEVVHEGSCRKAGNEGEKGIRAWLRKWNPVPRGRREY